MEWKLARSLAGILGPGLGCGREAGVRGGKDVPEGQGEEGGATWKQMKWHTGVTSGSRQRCGEQRRAGCSCQEHRRVKRGLTATESPFHPPLGQEDSVCHLSREEKGILMVGSEPRCTSAAGPGATLWLHVAVSPPGVGT